MNKLEAKAAELVEMAGDYGIDAEVETVGDHTVYVRFNKNLTSIITIGYKGHAIVKSYDQAGRRRDFVALRSLRSYLKFYAEQASLLAAVRKNPAIDNQTIAALEEAVA